MDTYNQNTQNNPNQNPNLPSFTAGCYTSDPPLSQQMPPAFSNFQQNPNAFQQLRPLQMNMQMQQYFQPHFQQNPNTFTPQPQFQSSMPSTYPPFTQPPPSPPPLGTSNLLDVDEDVDEIPETQPEPTKKSGGKGKKKETDEGKKALAWTDIEDVAVVKAWLATSKCPIVGK